MASRPLISIVTPTFNHAEFIGPCIESVLAQEYEHWELLVVNDGSDDETAAVAARYAEADPRIHLFDRENVGIFRLKETYNFALSKAQGEYVAILEGDDVWTPEKLRRQVDALAASPEAVLCWSRAIIAAADLDHIRTTDSDLDRVPQPQRLNQPVGVALDSLYVGNFIPAASILARTSTMRAIGGFQQPEGLPLVDYPTLLQLATSGTFAFVDEPLAKWRWHANQATKKFHINIIEHVRDTALGHFDSLPSEFRNLLTVTRAEIERHFTAEMHRAFVQSGRFKLVQRNYGAARQDFSKALLFQGLSRPGLRLQALAGIGSSILGTDLEWIARLLGKTDLSWKRDPVQPNSGSKTTVSRS